MLPHFAAHQRRSILEFTRHQVILEAIRLYPPVWVLTRSACHADRLLGYDAPGQHRCVRAFPYIVQRDPQHWPEPELFRPERFEHGADSAAHRFAYIPFSAGPRHCVGETFATYEMAIHIYHAARAFRLRSAQSGPREMEERASTCACARMCLMSVEPRRSLRALRYQVPMLGIDSQGSCGSSAAAFCSSSIDIRSGEHTNAILPSRGGG